MEAALGSPHAHLILAHPEEHTQDREKEGKGRERRRREKQTRTAAAAPRRRAESAVTQPNAANGAPSTPHAPPRAKPVRRRRREGWREEQGGVAGGHVAIHDLSQISSSLCSLRLSEYIPHSEKLKAPAPRGCTRASEFIGMTIFAGTLEHALDLCRHGLRHKNRLG